MAVAVAAFLAAGASVVPSTGDQASRLRGTADGTPASPAVAIRHQAAAWVASQVGGDAIIACDPAMCSALLAQGVTAGNLLVLRLAAADPLGFQRAGKLLEVIAGRRPQIAITGGVVDKLKLAEQTFPEVGRYSRRANVIHKKFL